MNVSTARQQTATTQSHTTAAHRIFILAFAIAITLFVAASAQAQTFKVIYSFTGASGSHPGDGVILTKSGTLIGTTDEGGRYNSGTIFGLTPSSGAEAVIHSFGFNPANGTLPNFSPLSDLEGNLWGVTSSGGNTSCSGGCGLVYLDNTNTGKFTILHRFAGPEIPSSRVVRDKEQNIYGTTSILNNPTHLGTVYKLDRDGHETVLHRFTETPDGAFPIDSLIADAAGNVYGTTRGGGDPTCDCGIIYKIDTTGKETILHTFTGSDGENPMGALVLDSAGNLFGATGQGGDLNCPSGFPFGCGTVFKLTPQGELTVLHNFEDNGDSDFPNNGVSSDSAGNLYGTTQGDGGSEACCATVFKITPGGNLTTLHTFSGNDNIGFPSAVVVDGSGNVFGTAGGSNSECECGVVFEITPN